MTNIEDITEDFFSSCRELNLGEIVKDESFDLFEAISAIEILDPKMDLGIHLFDDKLTLKELVKDNKVNVTVVPYPDLISIIDATMALIMCWLEGQLLDQTVYTNLCLIDLDTIKSPMLYGSCRGIINFMQGLKLCIETAGCFNDEDFTSFTAHTKLNFTFTPQCDELNAAIDILRRKKSNSEYEDQVLLEAIEYRLCFFKATFIFFSIFFTAAEDETMIEFETEVKLIDKILHYLDKVSCSTKFGTQPPTDDDSNYAWLPYFEPHANRLYSQPTFPREIKILSRRNAYEKYQNFFITIKQMFIQIQNMPYTLDSFLSFLQHFGSFGSSALSRSIAQLIIIPNNFMVCGYSSINSIVVDAINDLDSCLNGFDTELKVYKNIEPSDDIQHFFDLTTQTFLNAFKIFGHNIARQRDSLFKTCFKNLGMLQTMSYQIETDIIYDKSCLKQQPTILTTFLLMHISKFMLYHFELGFNLELFVPYEMPYIYFYYGRIVAHKLTSFLEKRCNLLASNFKKLYETASSSRKDKLIYKKRESDVAKNINHLRTEVNYHKINTLLNDAFLKFSLGLKFSNRLKIPENENVCFNQRFSVYSSLSKMLFVDYKVYSTTPEVKNTKNFIPEQYFAAAKLNFEEAVKYCRHLEENFPDDILCDLSIISRVAKQNTIVSNLLASSSNLNKKVVFETTHCKRYIFPFIRLI